MLMRPQGRGDDDSRMTEGAPTADLRRYRDRATRLGVLIAVEALRRWSAGRWKGRSMDAVLQIRRLTLMTGASGRAYVDRRMSRRRAARSRMSDRRLLIFALTMFVPFVLGAAYGSRRYAAQLRVRAAQLKARARRGQRIEGGDPLGPYSADPALREVDLLAVGSDDEPAPADDDPNIVSGAWHDYRESSEATPPVSSQQREG
jgi:hypothetical protein